MVRSCWFVIVLCLLWHAPVNSEETDAEEGKTRALTYEDLATLGDLVRETDFASYNPYLAATQSAAAHRAAAELKGREIEFRVEVDRVTESEVFLRVYDAGRTRVLMQFVDHSGNPYFGNRSTRIFHGPPSLSRSSRFAGPPAMRIGAGIELDLARKLSRHDVLVMKGRVSGIEVRIRHGYTPDSVATISDLRVVRRQVGETEDSYTDGEEPSETDAPVEEILQ